MKKTRFLVLALAVAVMLMGAGYAWWSETVTITTDVTTGYLDVDLAAVTPNTASSDYVGVTVTPVSSIEGNDNGEVCNIDVTNLYPGAFGSGIVAVKNTGTMKVKLGKPIVTFTDNNAAVRGYDYVGISYSPSLTDDSSPVSLSINPNNGECTFSGDVFLVPGETCYFTITASMPSNEQGDEFKSDLSFRFAPEFLQWNQQ